MIERILRRLREIPIHLPAKPRRRVADFWRRFGRGLNLAGLVLLLAVATAACFADLIASDAPIACRIYGRLHILPALFGPGAGGPVDNESVLAALGRPGDWALLPPVPYGPNQTKRLGAVEALRAPGWPHWLGTDDKGRDVLARIIHGARSALLVGLGSVGLYLILAVLIGAVAGYFGGLADRIALRLIETLSSFPSFFLILALQGLLGATSIAQLILVIGLTRWADVARLTRGEVLRVVHEDYVIAARAIGLRHLRILARHVLPSAMEPVFIAAAFGVANAILIEATLSFLGYGLPETTASWGQLLGDAFNNDGCYWLTLFPGLVLFLTVLSINLVGEGLGEALRPSSD